MKKNIKLISLLFLVCFCFTATAQKDIIESPDSIRKHLLQNTYSIDSNASAIILSEKGMATVEKSKTIYKVERIIKVFNLDAIEYLSDLNIPVSGKEQILHIEASTYNWKQDTIVRQDVSEQDIFREELKDKYSLVKLNFPSVQKGSVIYYSFTVSIPGVSAPEWIFQNRFPTLQSRYELHCQKGNWYRTLTRFNATVFSAKEIDELDTCTACTIKIVNREKSTVTSTEIWVRRNIPALNIEPLMSSPMNYVERVKILFGLATDNWTTFIYHGFYNTIYFGKYVFEPNHYLKKTIHALCNDKGSDMEKANAIFAFVRDSIKTSEYSSSPTFIKQVFKKRNGNETLKSLLLTAMLREAGLNAVPVITTTKYSERLNSGYPLLPGPIITVCKLHTNNKDYFLYPSGQMPFGILHESFYNGYARTIEKKSKAVYLSPDSIKNKTTIMVVAEPLKNEPNTLSLKMDIQFGQFSSYNNRSIWSKDTIAMQKAAAQYLDESNMDAAMLSYNSKNLNNLDALLGLHIEGKANLSPGKNYLDPFLYKFIEGNPFTDITREYPIELEYLQDYNYIFRLTLPDSYMLAEIPTPATFKVGLDGDIEMQSHIDFNKAENTLAIHAKLISKKATFPPDDYKYLRSFFENVIEEQNKKIILTPIQSE